MANTAKSETGLSRDSLARAIDFLETQPQSLVRDTTLMYYYNDLCEKSIFGNDPLAEKRLERFNKAWKKSLWPIGEALYLRAIGKKYDKLGRYEKAVESYHEALRIMEEHDSAPEHVVYTKILLGFVMLNNGDEKECWRLFKEAEPLALQLPNTSHAIWIFDFYGDNTLFHARGKEDYEKALGYYKKVEELLPRSLIKNQIPNNLQGQAAVYALLNNKEKAEEYRARALHEAKQIPNYFVLFNIYTDYAAAESEKGNFSKAIAYRKLAIAAADSQQYLEFINRAYYELYLTYKKSREVEKALATLEHYQVLEDSLKRQEVNTRYAELNKKYEFEQQQLAISDLQNKNLKYGLLALGVAIFGGLFFLIFQTNSKRKIARLNEQLSLRNHKVEEALYEGKKLERRRVSDKLHDSIATKLSALKWRVEASEEKIEKGVYAPLVADLEKLYEDVRGMAHELRPLEFLDKGLKAATEQLFNTIAEYSDAVFEVRIDEEVGQMNKSLQYHVYQIVTELCTNMQKHARPEDVLFTMQRKEEQLVIQFRNDGLMNMGNLKEGQGLRNIRSKVQEYGGNLNVKKEETFDLTITIPLV